MPGPALPAGHAIGYLFLPGTKTGWHFSYSSYGQICRVERRAGMKVDPSTGAPANAGVLLPPFWGK